MKEHPILFKTEMVEAILSGAKTQTRRIVKLPTGYEIQKTDICREVSPTGLKGRWGILAHDADPDLQVPQVKLIPCPYGGIGDRLWVRETFAYVPATAYKHSDGVQQRLNPKDPVIAAIYRAGWDRCLPTAWKPSLHMPRWASRLLLEIVDIDIERLQDISEADAAAEGCDHSKSEAAINIGWYIKPKKAFYQLWRSINGEESWDSNPWVWVVKFKIIDPDGQE